MLATSAGEGVHCGRVFSAAEIADLCATVAWLPGLARKELAISTALNTRPQCTQSPALVATTVTPPAKTWIHDAPPILPEVLAAV